jgi:4-methylaminobutanoate oxidase (formaldehyde-forming)
MNGPQTSPSADVIIIGAGVLGCSVAYHLARAGLKPLVLERGGIAQAATSRAAGLLSRARSKPFLLPLVRQTYEDLRDLEVETGASLGVRTTGSLYVGVSETAIRAHRQLMATAAAQGELVHRLTPPEALDLVPWLHLLGGEEIHYMPEDAFMDGYALGSGYARAARNRGARILEGQAVEAILTGRQRVAGVRTAAGSIASPVVVDAAGAWANLLAQAAGAAIPMAPVRSQYWITSPDRRFSRNMPFMILPDARAYARPEGEGLLFGFREAQSVFADPRDLPDDLQGHVVAGDANGWASLEEGAAAFQRFLPWFGELEIAHYVSGYSTYVPDGLLAVGPLAEPAGLYSAAGCSGGGVAMAGGVGRALAQMITGSAPAFDLGPHDPARFGAFDPFSPGWGRRCADARSHKTTG